MAVILEVERITPAELVLEYEPTVEMEASEIMELTYEEYDGPVTFTPDRTGKTFPTANKLIRDNITIKPIPENYGLITWNGSVLTVS